MGLKGELWVCRKSQKISTASDPYFLSYVKKTTGGVKLTPPPSRNRVNLHHVPIIDYCFYFMCMTIFSLMYVSFFVPLCNDHHFMFNELRSSSLILFPISSSFIFVPNFNLLNVPIFVPIPNSVSLDPKSLS